MEQRKPVLNEFCVLFNEIPGAFELDSLVHDELRNRESLYANIPDRRRELWHTVASAYSLVHNKMGLISSLKLELEAAAQIKDKHNKTKLCRTCLQELIKALLAEGDLSQVKVYQKQLAQLH